MRVSAVTHTFPNWVSGTNPDLKDSFKVSSVGEPVNVGRALLILWFFFLLFVDGPVRRHFCLKSTFQASFILIAVLPTALLYIIFSSFDQRSALCTLIIWLCNLLGMLSVVLSALNIDYLLNIPRFGPSLVSFIWNINWCCKMTSPTNTLHEIQTNCQQQSEDEYLEQEQNSAKESPEQDAEQVPVAGSSIQQASSDHLECVQIGKMSEANGEIFCA